MTSQLAEVIFTQQATFILDPKFSQEAMKTVKEMMKEQVLMSRLEALKAALAPDRMKTVELAAEKGASSWLTALLLEVCGFRLSKQQFADALCLSYNLSLVDVPRMYGCVSAYSISHCLSCKTCGFVHIRHNAARDTVAEMLTEVAKDVKVEPPLLPVTGEVLPTGTKSADNARAAISAVSFWAPLCRAYFDVRFLTHLPPRIGARILARCLATMRQRKREPTTPGSIR